MGSKILTVGVLGAGLTGYAWLPAVGAAIGSILAAMVSAATLVFICFKTYNEWRKTTQPPACGKCGRALDDTDG